VAAADQVSAEQVALLLVTAAVLADLLPATQVVPVVLLLVTAAVQVVLLLVTVAVQVDLPLVMVAVPVDLPLVIEVVAAQVALQPVTVAVPVGLPLATAAAVPVGPQLVMVVGRLPVVLLLVALLPVALLPVVAKPMARAATAQVVRPTIQWTLYVPTKTTRWGSHRVPQRRPVHLQAHPQGLLQGDRAGDLVSVGSVLASALLPVPLLRQPLQALPTST